MKRSTITPFAIHINELRWRITYVFTSFIFCFILVLNYSGIFFLLEVYPFTKFVFKTLIATQVTELFDSTLYVSSSISVLCVTPLVFFQVYSFLSTGLYVYQTYCLKVLCYLICFIWFVTFLFCYNLILPQFFDFLTQWEVKKQNIFFQLELNAKIYFYLVWVNNVYNSFSSSIVLLIFVIYSLFTLFHPNILLNFFKLYRKYLSFSLTCCFYIIAPPNYLLQICLLVISFLLCDTLFFFLCFRFKQCLIPGSSIG